MNLIPNLLLLIVFCLFHAGCKTIPLPSDHGRQWANSISKCIGSSYSEWIKANHVHDKVTLLVSYPENWSEEEWRCKYFRYAKRYEGYRDVNYLYEKRTSQRWKLREDGLRPSRETWEKDLWGDQRNNLSGVKRSEFSSVKDMRAHFIPIWRGRDPFKYHEDYIVVFTLNDAIVGYSTVSWGFGRGELDYIENEFGFVP